MIRRMMVIIRGILKTIFLVFGICFGFIPCLFLRYVRSNQCNNGKQKGYDGNGNNHKDSSFKAKQINKIYYMLCWTRILFHSIHSTHLFFFLFHFLNLIFFFKFPGKLSLSQTGIGPIAFADVRLFFTKFSSPSKFLNFSLPFPPLN